MTTDIKQLIEGEVNNNIQYNPPLSTFIRGKEVEIEVLFNLSDMMGTNLPFRYHELNRDVWILDPSSSCEINFEDDRYILSNIRVVGYVLSLSEYLTFRRPLTKDELDVLKGFSNDLKFKLRLNGHATHIENHDFKIKIDTKLSGESKVFIHELNDHIADLQE